MLKEISCNKFIKSPIVFDKGLNTVLGDNYSTNSIGKSLFLMILDFVFGGNSYTENDSGALKNVGHHTLNFNFIFKHNEYFYSRSTENPKVIHVCDKDYNSLREITTSIYTSELKKLYEIENPLTFRSIVNPFSRIWGKDNYDVNKPLFNNVKESESKTIINLIKLFESFNAIQDTASLIKDKEEAKSAINEAQKKDYIPKITKTAFKQNESEIERIKKDIADIQENLLKFTINVEELSSKELVHLKSQKSRLLSNRDKITNKINRLDLNLGNKSVKSKHLKRLSEFFDNPNEEKITEIESFHNRISKILERELLASKSVLEEELKDYNVELEKIDNKISILLENVKSPKFIVEKIYDLTIESNKLETANKFYSEKEFVAEEIKSLNTKLESTLEDILNDIAEKINGELVRINKEIHSEKKKVPRLLLKRSSYQFDHSGNTGTGKSFSDLIEFDLSILKLTSLPFIIHDSVLFKNIEDMAIDKITEQYMTFDKQIFMALDGINKFDNKTQDSLNNQSVLRLSESNKLFNMDWR